jgi:hypothetical protein
MMATWEDVQSLIQAIADSRDDPGAYGLRTPGEPIEIGRNVEIIPGGSWGENKPFQIYLEGLSEYLDTLGVSGVSAIKSKLNELIAAYNQLRSDYNNSVWPTTAPSVTQLP